MMDLGHQGYRLGNDEKERRKRRVIEILDEKDLDCVIVFGSMSTSKQYQFYLSNSRFDTNVLLTREGELIDFMGRSHRIERQQEQGIELWPDKIVRVGATHSKALIEEIERLGFDDGRIGVVGVGFPRGGARAEGWVPYGLWKNVLDAFPDATFEDVASEYFETMLVKSPAEIKLLEQAAAAGDAQIEVVLDKMKAGVRDNKLWAEFLAEPYRQGATNRRYPKWVLAPNGENTSWRGPRWRPRPYPRPRPLREGDVIISELFPMYGGLEAQQQMTVGIGPLHEDTLRAAELAEESLLAGLKVAKPGITMADLADAMEEPILEADAGWLTPHVHTLNPIYSSGRMRVNLDTGQETEAKTDYNDEKHSNGDLVLKEGMAFAFEPNCVIGNRRVDIGGTFVMTDSGLRGLEELPNQMHIV